MFSKTRLLLSLVALTAAVFAAPTEHRLEDIQCRCLSFSTSAKPTLCTYLESHGLDWTTAYSLASDNSLKIQFASQSTITKVLEMRRPLPRSVLHAIGNGAAVHLPATNLMHTENKIVCGFGDEATHTGSQDMDLAPESHYVGAILAAFMLFLLAYLVVDYAWTKYVIAPSLPRHSTNSLPGTLALDKETSSWKATKRP